MQIVQYISNKIVKPKLIPKLDFQNGIPKESATFVVIPTIITKKEKIDEMMKKLEVYYIANIERIRMGVLKCLKDFYEYHKGGINL